MRKSDIHSSQPRPSSDQELQQHIRLQNNSNYVVELINEVNSQEFTSASQSWYIACSDLGYSCLGQTLIWPPIAFSTQLKNVLLRVWKDISSPRKLCIRNIFELDDFENRQHGSVVLEENRMGSGAPGWIEFRYQSVSFQQVY
jgi:hypothetical protein